MTLEAQTSAIDHSAASYQAANSVHEILHTKTLLPLLGPFAVGKTTIMKQAASTNGNFHRVRSFTTREKRTGEDENTYDFLPHNQQTLENIRNQIAARALVQFMVHPTTKNIYGTHIRHYGSPTQAYAMLDIVPKALPALEALPFKAIKKVEVVVPPNEWIYRMKQRLATGDHDDVRKRLLEGTDNLEWALDQGNDITWLNNGGRKVGETALDLINIAQDQHESDTSARMVGEELLTTMKHLRP